MERTAGARPQTAPKGGARRLLVDCGALTFAVAALLGIGFLPRSGDVALVRRWQTMVGPLTDGLVPPWLIDRTEAGWLGFVGRSDRQFHVDGWGRIEMLRVRNAGLRTANNLPGLERLTALRHLDLSNNPLSGTLDVSALRQLEVLRLRDTSLTRIVGLDALSALREIDLSGSPVNGVIDFSSSSDLETIRAGRTRVTRIEGLEKLSQLSTLDLEESAVKLVAPVSSTYHGLLPEASILRLRERLGSIVGTAAMGGSGGGLSANLAGTPIRDLRFLRPFPGPLSLSLAGLDLSRVVGLDELRQTRLLTLARCTSVDLRTVSSLRSLTELVLDHSDVADLGPLSELATLASLSLVGTHPGAVGLLRGLEEVDLRDTEIAPDAFHATALVLTGPVAAWQLRPRAWGERERRVVLRIAAALGLTAVAVLLLSIRLLTPVTARLSALTFRLLGGLVYALLLLYGASLLLPLTRGRGEDAILTGAAVLVVMPFVIVGVDSLPPGRLRLWLRAAADAATALSVIGTPLVLMLNVLDVLSAQKFVRLLCWPTVATMTSVASIATGYFIALPALQWERARKRLVTALAGNGADGVVLISGIRCLGPVGIGLRLQPRGRSVHGPRPVLIGCDVGTLRSISMPSHHTRLGGVVLRINRRDLSRVAAGEVADVARWLRMLHESSTTPIWIVGDWVGSLDPPPARTNLDALTSLLSGYEPYLDDRLDEHLIPARVPRIAGALAVNALVDLEELQVLGLRSLLRHAATPVAALVRATFGEFPLVNRLDVLLRAAETGVQTLGLVLACERGLDPADTNETNRLDRALARALRAPTFGDWEALLRALCRHPASDVAHRTANALNEQAGAAAVELARLLANVAKGRTVVPPSTRWDALSTLRETRNLMVAHGPLTEDVSPEVYAAVLRSVIGVLTALPWDRFRLEIKGPLGAASTQCGSLASRTDGGATRDGPWRVAIVAASSGAEVGCAERFFRPVVDGTRLALRVGRGTFVDPVSGARVHGGGDERA